MSSLFFENYDFVSPPHYRVVDVVLLSSMVVSAGYLHYTTLHSTTTHHLKFTSTDWMRLWRPEPKILRVKHKIWGWSDSAINIPYLFRFSLFFLTPDWDPPTSQQTLNIPSIVLSPLVLWCHSVLLEFFQILCIILIFPNRKTTRPNFPPPFCLHIDDTLRFVPAIHLLPVASLFFFHLFSCVYPSPSSPSLPLPSVYLAPPICPPFSSSYILPHPSSFQAWPPPNSPPFLSLFLPFQYFFDPLLCIWLILNIPFSDTDRFEVNYCSPNKLLPSFLSQPLEIPVLHPPSNG